MEAAEYELQFFVLENRIASFQGPQPVARRRTSTAANSRAPKALTWPHKSPAALELARAGFFFNPQPSNPDNVKCFLCKKDLDGWEEDDDPLQEHLKHSSNCGWAMCAAIELDLGDVADEDPRMPYLVEARKATFAGRWPYESKKGWKCKTKQLAEAGWLYTPTLESDDNTTCAYCQLALDGWEAGDKPLEEHQKRSPGCPFFILTSKYPAPKKTARSKAARSSKVSRLSVQSATTAASDAASIVDPEDSVLTTTSTVTTQGAGGRKAPRSRKAAGTSTSTTTTTTTTTTTGRARKTRVKKDEPVGVLADVDADPAAQLLYEQEMGARSPAVHKAASRGKKRNSDEMDAADASQMDASVAHATKKHRGRASSNVTSHARSNVSADYAMFDPEMPESDEAAIEAELRALERDMEVEESVPAAAPSPLPEIQVPKKGRKAGTARKVSKQTRKAKEEAVEAQPEPQLESGLAREQEHEQKAEPVPVQPKAEPKSKAKAKAKMAAPPVPLHATALEDDADELHEDSVISIASSNGTMVRGPANGAAVEQPKEQPKRRRGRPSKQSLEPQSSLAAAEATANIAPGAPSQRTSHGPAASQEQPEEPLPSAPVPAAKRPAAAAKASKQSSKQSPKQPAKETRILPPVIPERHMPLVHAPRAPLPPLPPHHARDSVHMPGAPPSTPRASYASPATSARQAILSPSQSPQSSDAENQPPSSKATKATKPRVVLAAVTPVHQKNGAAGATAGGSPSKSSNTMGGLRSTAPWTAVDVESIFMEVDDKENGEDADAGLVARLLERPGGELNTPEKAMTVEEFIYHNAGHAEQLLREECEAMVSMFERQGTRAMQALEAVIVDE